MLDFEIIASRVGDHGSLAQCKDAELVIDTALKGCTDAFTL